MASPDGVGSTTWWGFSPAFDLIAEREAAIKQGNDDELHVLVVGAGDGRHILKTLACRYKHGAKKITFYVVEHSLELCARQMLFLLLAVEPPSVMGLQGKTHLFMELYGNTQIRGNTQKYLRDKAGQLMLMTTDFGYMARRMPILNLSMLKYREVDALEFTFKFWRTCSDSDFNITKHWDVRQRSYLGVRYDARRGGYDWDYHMKLSERGAAIIGSQDYKRWRETGLAFEVFDSAEGTFPNLTLVSGIVLRRNGEVAFHRGYCGDIVTGPFVTYGIECEDKEMFKKANGIYKKTARDLTERNVMRMMYELARGKKYVADDPEKGCQIREVEEDEPTEWQPKRVEGKRIEEEKYEPIATGDAQVVFLPLGVLTDIGSKEKYREKFNMAFFSASMTHKLNSDVVDILKPGATLLVETAKFILDLRPENAKSLTTRIVELAEAAGCQLLAEIREEDVLGRFARKS